MTYYYLLTGGTGLLGSYLLRDFLLAGHRMAVLVRPTQTQSGPQRVDASLAHWETSYLSGRIISRPYPLRLCRVPWFWKAICAGRTWV
jgi:thioester reductase-like protein